MLPSVDPTAFSTFLILTESFAAGFLVPSIVLRDFWMIGFWAMRFYYRTVLRTTATISSQIAAPKRRLADKFWRVFFWSNHPKRALPCFIFRFERSSPLICREAPDRTRPRVPIVYNLGSW